MASNTKLYLDTWLQQFSFLTEAAFPFGASIVIYWLKFAYKITSGFKLKVWSNPAWAKSFILPEQKESQIENWVYIAFLDVKIYYKC